MIATKIQEAATSILFVFYKGAYRLLYLLEVFLIVIIANVVGAVDCYCCATRHVFELNEYLHYTFESIPFYMSKICKCYCIYSFSKSSHTSSNSASTYRLRTQVYFIHMFIYVCNLQGVVVARSGWYEEERLRFRSHPKYFSKKESILSFIIISDWLSLLNWAIYGRYFENRHENQYGFIKTAQIDRLFGYLFRI